MRSILILAAVMFVSGCVIQTTPFMGSGLVISEFSADFPTIYSGDEVHLGLKLSNTGSVDANVVGMDMTGLDLKSWKEKSNSCKELSRTPIKPGGSVNCIIALVAPDIGNLEVPFTPKIHVTYSYSSNAIALVTVGTTDELRRIALQGGSLPYEAKSSAGPVSIDIKASSPIRASGTSAEFPVRMTVTNGAGTACSGKCSPSTWNKIKLSITTTMQSAGCPSQIELILYKGQSNSFFCNMKAASGDAGAGLTQKSIEVQSDYGYIIEAETSLSIKRRTI